MIKPLSIILLGLMLSLNAFAGDDEKEPVPLDPAFMGGQKMALAVGGQNLFAINIVTYQRPANVQLIYELSTKDPILFYLVRDADLVTMKTKSFNLERLIRGEEVSVVADVYLGHFDQGGMLTYEGKEVTFTKKVYARDLATETLSPSSTKREYASVELPGNERMLIHKVQQAPSFQHLVFFHESKGCVTNFVSATSLPSPNELHNKLTLCGSMKPLYYTTDYLK